MIRNECQLNSDLVWSFFILLYVENILLISFALKLYCFSDFIFM